LTAKFSGGLNNRYIWYKDTVAITDTLTTPTLKLTNLLAENSGVYRAEIINTIATDLVLDVRPVTVIVQDSTSSVSAIANVSAYPVPFSSSTTLLVKTPSAETLFLTIYNDRGIAITRFPSKTNQNISIGDNLQRGVYYITASFGKEAKTLRVVKE